MCHTDVAVVQNDADTVAVPGLPNVFFVATSLQAAVTQLVRDDPALMDGLPTFASFDGTYFSPASGSVYRTHSLLRLGTSIALGFYTDFISTAMNTRSRSGLRKRNWGVLCAVVCNIPHMFLRRQCFIPLAIWSKSMHDLGMTFNHVWTHFQKDLASLRAGMSRFSIVLLHGHAGLAAASTSCHDRAEIDVLVGVDVHFADRPPVVVRASFLCMLGDNEAQQIVAGSGTSSSTMFCRQCTQVLRARDEGSVYACVPLLHGG
jgi:hypothetical protein